MRTLWWSRQFHHQLAVTLVLFLGCTQNVVKGDAVKTSPHVTDLTRGCRSQLIVGIKFPNASERHRTIFTLSTGSVVAQGLLLTSDSGDFRLPCLYHGVNSVTKESMVAHESHGVFRSEFKSRGKWYRIRRSIVSTEDALAVPIVLNEEGFDSGLVVDQSVSAINEQHMAISASSRINSALSRKKRSLKLQSFNDSATRKVLELVVVADSGYVAKFGGWSSAVSRILEILKYVNGVYQDLGLRIVVKSVVTFAVNPFNVTQSIDPLLRDFSVYKVLNIKVRYDAAILMLPRTMKHVLAPGLTTEHTSVTWQNGLCQLFSSSGIVSDVSTPIQASWLVSHSIGALSGFKNVEDVSGCSCSTPKGCVMNNNFAIDPATQQIDWSTCSVDSWKSQADAIWRSCLKDVPDESFSFTGTARCGNGIVESGEQCDCGPALTCKSTCCDPNTCLLRSGAECANGACCNTSSCRLKARGSVCRDSEGPCDVAETCNGSSEWCPADDRVADGMTCATNASYCYKGECGSSLSQCQLLFGDSASVADVNCFTTINTLTNGGYCHTNLIAINGTNRQYSIIRCSAADAVCGTQHCSLPTKPTVGSTYTLSSGKSCSSRNDIDLTSSGLRNADMVPDGASCGLNSMCVNSSCLPLSAFACPDCPDCHGNGLLTRSKRCFCKPGFAPPDCSAVGCGGSVTSPGVCAGPLEATSSVAPTASSVAPTASSVARTTSSAAPTTSLVAPTTSSAAPTTSSVAPTTAPETATTTEGPPDKLPIWVIVVAVVAPVLVLALVSTVAYILHQQCADKRSQRENEYAEPDVKRGDSWYSTEDIYEKALSVEDESDFPNEHNSYVSME